MPIAAKVFNRKKRLILGVKLDYLEARPCPVEHLDMRTPRGKSRLGADHQGRVID